MKTELDEALCRDFPNVYRSRHDSMRTTCMCWGFSCGDGWEPLLRRLSEKLEKIIIDTVPDEWKEETISLNSEYLPLDPETEAKVAAREPTWNPETKTFIRKYNPRHSVCASQVKEKFGTLRFYMTSENEEMSKAIGEAERESARTCETCGAEGMPRDMGWITVLCSKCLVERSDKDYLASYIDWLEGYKTDLRALRRKFYKLPPGVRFEKDQEETKTGEKDWQKSHLWQVHYKDYERAYDDFENLIDDFFENVEVPKE
jgi:hypothetical protein